jgi:hypothetical protein
MKKINTTDLDDVHVNNAISSVKLRLEKKGYSVVVLDDASEIYTVIDRLVPDEASVSLDGSAIFNELEVHSILTEKWNVIFDPYQKGLAPEIKNYLFEKIMRADYFFVGPDALTLDGNLVFEKKDHFLVNTNQEKPRHIMAFIGSEKLMDNYDSKNKPVTVLELSPFGLKSGFIDNYGQMEEVGAPEMDRAKKQNSFTIILIKEEFAY